MEPGTCQNRYYFFLTTSSLCHDDPYLLFYSCRWHFPISSCKAFQPHSRNLVAAQTQCQHLPTFCMAKRSMLYMYTYLYHTIDRSFFMVIYGANTCFIFHRVIKQAMTPDVSVLGGVTLQVALPCIMHALQEYLHVYNLALPPGQLVTMYRIEVRGTLYYSRQYQRVKKRNSYTIAYLDRNKLKKFALIEYFVYIHQRVIAVLKPLLPLHISCKEHFNLTTTVLDTVSFMYPVRVADSYSFCFAEDIVSKCLFVDFSYTQYVVQFPSSVTFD